MLSPLIRSACLLASAIAFSPALLHAAPAKPKVEAGLEEAVGWKWMVAPSPVDGPVWGSAPPEPEPTPTLSQTAEHHPDARPSVYEVKKGDALVLIAKKFGLGVVHLKTFNGMTSDLIRVGDIVKIPTLDEARVIAPLPEPPRPPVPKGKKKPAAPSPSELVSLQVFLDREGFSTGPIDGKESVLLGKVCQLYRESHPELHDQRELAARAASSGGDGLTTYTVKPQDFRYIAPPKAERYDASKVPGSTVAPRDGISASTTYQDLTTAPFLAYRTPWEFVAERFHCDETYLRSLNNYLKAPPGVGTELRVPNVVPFEIERALVEPLQPPPEMSAHMKVTVADASLLQIYQDGKLVGVVPVATARPGLRGKGMWTILNAIPRPRLDTLQEPREKTAQAAPRLFGTRTAEPTPTPTKPVLTTEQYIASGPDNPVGILWINLAKENSSEPLPYGLHGTSIPDQMDHLEGIGGFRLTNWDIARIVRLLPSGTPLEWQAGGLTPPPVAKPAN